MGVFGRRGCTCCGCGTQGQVGVWVMEGVGAWSWVSVGAWRHGYGRACGGELQVWDEVGECGAGSQGRWAWWGGAWRRGRYGVVQMWVPAGPC